MPDSIIPFPKPASKPRRRLSTSLIVHDGKEPVRDELSLLEREHVKFSIADQAAIVLRLNSDIDAGHKAMLYAHLVTLKQRHGDQYAADVLALMAGMIGCEMRFHAIDYVPHHSPDDLSDVELS